MAGLSYWTGYPYSQTRQFRVGATKVMLRIVRRIGKSTLVFLFLLTFFMSSVAWSLSNVIGGLKGYPLASGMFLATVIGWLLARSKLPGWNACLLAILTGLTWLSFRFGELTTPLFSFLKAWLAFSQEFWHWGSGVTPDFHPVVVAMQAIGSHLGELYGHIYNWVLALIVHSLEFDPLAVAFMWSLVLWICCIWTAWSVRRHGQALIGIFPTVVLLAFVLNFTRAEAEYIIPFATAGLSLMIASSYKNNENSWKKRKVDYSEDIPVDLAMISGLIMSSFIAIAFLVMVMPDISVHNLFDRFRPITTSGNDNNLAGSIGLEQNTQQPGILVNFKAPGMPREHLLGSGPELSQKIVMVVQDLPASSQETTASPPASPADSTPPSYHWRSLSYDVYTGHGWLSSQTTELRYPSGFPIIPAQLPERILLEQQISFVGETSGILYAAGEVVSVNQDYEVAWRSDPGVLVHDAPAYDNNRSLQEFLALEFLRSADLFGAHLKANAYTVRSLLLIASQEALRQTGSNYPPQIASTYLSLPEALPQRIRNLADELTAGLDSPYDKAVAIENYLHTFPYTLDIGTPPANRDVTDYFLFDLRKGYCDYFATAMVVLSRAAGIPARLVVGYAGGTYDPINQRYVISEANAHSWVEIYFPGLGWVEFEPTPGLPAFDRPEIDMPGNLTALPPDIFTQPVKQPPIIRWILPLAITALLLTAFLGFYFVLTRRQRSFTPGSEIARIYQRMHRSGSRLILPIPAGTTPLEFAKLLWLRLQTSQKHPMRMDAKLVTRPYHLVRERVISPAESEIASITEYYNQAMYSCHPATHKQCHHAVRAWTRLKWRLWVARLFLPKNTS